MDEIEKRLRESSESCFNNYEAWRKNQKDNDKREALLDAIHELRKVASRLEIEVAVSERDEMAQRPIPIPPHRDAQRRGQPQEADQDFNSFDDGQAARHQSQPQRHQHGGGQGGQRRRLGRRSEGGGNIGNS
ncbi:MAG: hypothetical protein IT558_03910 [Alphaproteobacteria bacterium]|nr:hypothetical protein [Alphaproteobacteria bacterium]